MSIYVISAISANLRYH